MKRKMPNYVNDFVPSYCRASGDHRVAGIHGAKITLVLPQDALRIAPLVGNLDPKKGPGPGKGSGALLRARGDGPAPLGHEP